ncbi:MAG: hypothetical protein SFU86_06715 [Pirellulaceae bacterium]|nr:hypothetical protein [Pirellulaceae bacterium]
MPSYATQATVEAEGQIRVPVPFPVGTVLEVTVQPQSPAVAAEDQRNDEAVARLFAALDKARNTEPVGSLRREELYDRDVLHRH